MEAKFTTVVALKSLQFKIGTDVKCSHFKYDYFLNSQVPQISMLRTFPEPVSNIYNPLEFLNTLLSSGCSCYCS